MLMSLSLISDSMCSTWLGTCPLPPLEPPPFDGTPVTFGMDALTGAAGLGEGVAGVGWGAGALAGAEAAVGAGSAILAVGRCWGLAMLCPVACLKRASTSSWDSSSFSLPTAHHLIETP